eukprot:GHVL01027509.1.p1 GENE.GHVL01027509.1~~GHVL01027509.1.p1  ORF type:complete len:342 (-),score=64.87 GHVL01027509.1:240-1265(-)
MQYEDEEEETPSWTWNADYNIWAVAFASNPEPNMWRFVCGSLVKESDSNEVSLIELNSEKTQLQRVVSAKVPFPPSKFAWNPHGMGGSTFASSGDGLSIWRAMTAGTRSRSASLKQLRHLGGSKAGGKQGPLTSCAWNPSLQQKVATSSVDTTCASWDIEVGKMETRLIAHDKAVYDICYGPLPYLFASVGADGSVRVFDLRDLESSTILYEHHSPMLRVAWKSHYLAVVARDDHGVSVIDIRKPNIPHSHLMCEDNSFINSVAWSPPAHGNQACFLATASDNGRAALWPAIGSNSKSARTTQRPEPVWVSNFGRETVGVHWPHKDWLGVALWDRVSIVPL